MPVPSSRIPLVLVVEDDPHGLSFMESSLALAGFGVVSAKSVPAAREELKGDGLSRFSAVLTDYRLPGENGIELLKRIREADPTLSTVVITGQGEKSIVQDSIALGAYHYLEKPVTHQLLRRVITGAVAQTRNARQSRLDRRELEDLEQFDQRMSGVIPEGLQDRMRVLYKPLHEVGGDFFITHHYSSSEWVILVGDVSGHDIKSGFVSTYFQGMFRGCVENGSRVQEFLELFNRTLRHQSKARLPENELISLSISALYINFEAPCLCHWNFGFAPCFGLTRDGRITEYPFGRFPLGWVADIDLSANHIPVQDLVYLYVFTDGLVELSSDLEVNTLSLLFKLMHDSNVINSLPIEPKDDILTLQYILNPTLPLNTNYQPLLSEHYAGTEVDHIDHLQSNWRRSLSFALDDKLGDRLYDLLICIREGMLNALIHGCERAPDKFAHLQISLNPDQTALRVVIDDPGRGHQFDLKQRLNEIGGEGGKHLGLGIIQYLSDDFQIENKGTSLVFDFEINPVPVS